MGSLKVLIFLFIFLSKIAYTAQYIDSYGRAVNIEKQVKSIVAVGPGALRVISYLDAVDMLKGVENIEIKYPSGRSYSVAYHSFFKSLPVIGEGGADKIPDYEKIKILSPDLIIASSISKDIIEDMEKKTGIKVYSFDYGMLGSFETEKFKKSIKEISKIINRETRADFILKRVDYYVSDLRKRTAQKKDKLKIYVGGLGFKGSHGITSTQYSYEPFELLGIKSVVDELEKKQKINHLFIDSETLLKLDPDYIFIDTGGLDIFIDDYIKNSSFYNSISAFKKGNVYTTLPFNYYTTNVDVVFVNSYFIGKILFPEGFKDVNIRKICSDIMKDFVKKDVCDTFSNDKRFYKKVVIKDGKIEFNSL